ncbi:MAG: capsule assembly Wzi family protein [Thalassotalea sp.]|nr:capsule assembly Wzi family protein [Thalassotalea sp.]
MLLPQVKAEPYIAPDDLSLRANIQLLVEQGVLQTMTTTYPMMWVELKRAMDQVDEEGLSGNNLNAYLFLQQQYELSKGTRSVVRINGAAKANRFHSFGDDFRNKNNANLALSSDWNNVSVKLSTSVTSSDIDGDEFQFDGSYVGFVAGNWNVNAGLQDRWWGPGWDSNLGLTNNARPMPTITLSRNQAFPFKVPFTEYEIPWTVTTFMGQMEEERHVPNTLLWGFRFSFMPIDNLEISLTRLAQWSGDDRPSDFDTFTNVLIGKDNCDRNGLDCGVNNSNEPGNQQAGYDLRYSLNIFEKAFTVYGTYYGEDGSTDNLSFISRPIIQAGFDTSFNWFGDYQKVYLEYSDTFKSCSNKDAPDRGNCFYEHHIYHTGMRYKGRNLGNLYDNDSESIVGGLIWQNFDKSVWTVKLRYLEVNNDDLDRYPNDPNLGHTISKVSEDIIMFSGDYEKTLPMFTYKIGTSISQSEFTQLSSSNEFNVFLQLRKEL